MKEWFENLSGRERSVLIGGGVVLAVLLLYFLGWEPLHDKVDDLRASTVEQRELLVWMRGATAEAKRLQGSARPARPLDGQSMLAVIDTTARAGKLGESLNRVQPESGDAARVWLERASFDLMVQWLEELRKNHGIRVQSASIEPKAEPGLIDARLVLQGGGA
jgi:general secretion pathway protein M